VIGSVSGPIKRAAQLTQHLHIEDAAMGGASGTRTRRFDETVHMHGEANQRSYRAAQPTQRGIRMPEW